MFPSFEVQLFSNHRILRVGKRLRSSPIPGILSIISQVKDPPALDGILSAMGTILQGSPLHCYKILPHNHWKSASLNFFLHKDPSPAIWNNTR